MFETASVRDVMISRVEIAAVDVVLDARRGARSSSPAEAHSRMPVFRDSLDEPLGFIHIKDVVAEGVRCGWSAEAAGLSQPVEKLVRDIMFVPESTLLPDLLVQMQASRIHIAIVVDEFGGTGGMVCLEDLVEQIVGDIEDEHDETLPADHAPRPLYRGKSMVSPTSPTSNAKPACRCRSRISRSDVDTIGGLVDGAGRPRPAGRRIDRAPARFRRSRSVAADPRRVIRLRLKAPKPAPSRACRRQDGDCRPVDTPEAAARGGAMTDSRTCC